VVELARAPGMREARWMQLLTGPAPQSVAPEPRVEETSAASALAGEVAALREEVAALRAAVEALRNERDGRSFSSGS
jgi:uncharacterized protein